METKTNVKIHPVMIQFIQVNNSLVAMQRDKESQMISLISQIGNKSEIVLQARLVLTTWAFPTPQHKQTYKISLQRCFAVRFLGYGIKIKLNLVEYAKLNNGEKIGKKGNIISAKKVDNKPTTPTTPTTPNDNKATVARLEKDVNNLNDTLSVSKAGHKQAKGKINHQHLEIDALKKEVKRLETENGRLRRESQGNKDVYLSLAKAIKSNKTRKDLVSMVG